MILHYTDRLQRIGIDGIGHSGVAKALEPKDQWIPVSKLPEVKGMEVVQVYLTDGKIIIPAAYRYKEWSIGHMPKINFTHWLPLTALPEPPQQ